MNALHRTLLSARSWLVPVALVLLWEASIRLHWVGPNVLTSWADVLGALRTPEAAEVWQGWLWTVRRLVSGVVLGASGGLALGMLMALSGRAERLIGPSFHGVRQVALFAWIPLITAWFGNGEWGKTVFVATAAFYPMAMGSIDGLRGVPRAWREVGAVLKLGPGQRLVRILLPAAAPSILAGLQLSLIYGWLAAIGAEYMLGVGIGLGNVLEAGREQFRMDLVLLGLCAIGLSGAAINAVFDRLRCHVLRWRIAGAGRAV
ncbi:ABC transporter permease [Uliginosibacterium sp. sgz301328]|uniref:ABC transporter permease n=1 Tax=Uliginosibacterium sp. sgz301328 TaxID=3243764 RepID=UPI00359E9630